MTAHGAKQCFRCSETKPATLEHFYRDRDGLRNDCRECVKAAARVRTQIKAHQRPPKPLPPTEKTCSQCATTKPRTVEYFSKKGRYLSAICLECNRDNLRRWRRDHPDRSCAGSRRYYLANRDDAVRKRKEWTARNYERQREAIAAWNQQHPEKLREYSQRRRARKVGAEGSFTAADVERLFAEQSGRCFYCGIALDQSYEIEHKTPLARGGSNWPSNLCCACKPCNRAKRTRTAEEFMRTLAVAS